MYLWIHLTTCSPSFTVFTHEREREREIEIYRKRERDTEREREIHREGLASFLVAWAFDALLDSSYKLLTVVHRIHTHEREREREREIHRERERQRQIQREGLASFLAACAFDALVDSSYRLLTVVNRIHTHKRDIQRKREIKRERKRHKKRNSKKEKINLVLKNQH